MQGSKVRPTCTVTGTINNQQSTSTVSSQQSTTKTVNSRSHDLNRDRNHDHNRDHSHANSQDHSRVRSQSSPDHNRVSITAHNHDHLSQPQSRSQLTTTVTIAVSHSHSHTVIVTLQLIPVRMVTRFLNENSSTSKCCEIILPNSISVENLFDDQVLNCNGFHSVCLISPKIPTKRIKTPKKIQIFTELILHHQTVNQRYECHSKALGFFFHNWYR